MAFLRPVGLAGSDDGGGGGPLAPVFDLFKMFNDFVSSTGGGFLIAQASGAEFNRKWEEFVAQADEATRATAQMLQQTVGIGGPTRQVRSDITDPEARAWIQERIDSGQAVNEDWYDQLTEEVPQFPSAIAGAFEVSREGRRLGKEFFDPQEASQRFRDEFAPIVEGFQALPGQVSAANERVQGLFGDLRGELRAGGADLLGGFEDILGTATDLVSGLGEFERQDINRRFTEAGSELQMGLSARGLGGSTISSSIGSGIERERSTALLGLQEQTARQQLSVQETFGLAGLSAQERLLGAGINLGGQRAGALQFGNQLFANTSLGALGARGNIAAGQVGAYDQAAMNQLNNLLAFGGFPVQTQLAGAGLGLNLFESMPLFPPTPNAPPAIYPFGD